MGPHCSHEVQDSIDDLIGEDPEMDRNIGMSHLERLCWIAESQIDYPRQVWYRCRGMASPERSRTSFNFATKYGPEEPSLVFGCFARLESGGDGFGI
jgi:hypothetical protein